MRGASRGGRTLWLARISFVVAVLAVLVYLNGGIVKATNFYEDLVFAIAPSADLAHEYGERHFDARYPEMYDIDRAEYFYRELEKIDLHYPYLYHQLARIEFLKGNFDKAMTYINVQISLHGTDAPNSYYVRGLIEGYKGDYGAAARDYGFFYEKFPNSWAAATDYAWVLLKGGMSQRAAEVTGEALKVHPTNPWVLAMRAVALYEIRDFAGALDAATEARVQITNITESDWLKAYPGNDPRIAEVGMATQRTSIAEIIHKTEMAIAEAAIQSE